ncbi:hypothetical protein BGX27_010588 [Mortierella sp. AM989]|nr:hypothetical protein BGX27_010588 [Mortierella sp. AM989]
MFLLLVSFTALSTLPYFPIYMLGLPFHLLIFSIFNRLMDEWLWWCIGCYTVLTLAPTSALILARLKVHLGLAQHDPRGNQIFLRNKHSASPQLSSNYKYSPIRSIDNDYDSQPCSNNLDPKRRSTLAATISRIEYGAQLVSVSNRNSIKWRMLLAISLWLSYVIPVTLENESRSFNPAAAAPSFDVSHPEPLCSAREMDGFSPRFDSFDGYWQEYLQFHRQMVLPEKQGGVPEKNKRYLVFQPSDDGLGNRLQALLSSVVLAMVTRRAIILDWVAMPQCNANFTDLFQQPEGLLWDLNTTLPNHKDLSYYKNKPDIWYPYCRNCALRSPITPDSSWSELLCNENLGINSSIPLVQILSTQWFLPVIQHNPYWRREMCHMFPQVQGLNPEQNVGFGNTFEVLAKKLLKPSTVVQQKIDSVMDRIPEGVTLIGLQVRRTENNAVGRGIEDSFLSCAASVVEEEEEANSSGFSWDSSASKKNNNNKSWSSSEDNELDSIIAQRGHTLDSTSGKRRYAYYLATDYRPTRAHFQKVLGDELFVLDNTFQSHKDTPSLSLSRNSSGKVFGNDDLNVKDDEDSSNIALKKSTLSDVTVTAAASSNSGSSSSQTEAVVRNSVQGVQIAVAEMYLLAQSNRIISSPYSTFGYFAHGYANIQPNIVRRDGKCIKRKSTQPCFQYWFGFANGGAKCNIKATIDMSEDYDCWL